MGEGVELLSLATKEVCDHQKSVLDYAQSLGGFYQLIKRVKSDNLSATLKPYVLDIDRILFANEDDFFRLIASLPGDKKAIIKALFYSCVADKIHSGFSLSRVMEHYPLKAEAIFNHCYGRLKTMIQSAFDYLNGLKQLSSAQKALYFEALEDSVPDLICHSRSVLDLMQNLPPTLRRQLFNKHRALFLSLIQHGRDLFNIVEYLDEDLTKVVFNEVKDRVAKNTYHADELLPAMRVLSLEDATWLLRHLKTPFISIVQRKLYFFSYLDWLTMAQLDLIAGACEGHFSCLFKSPKKYLQTFRRYTDGQKRVFFSHLKHELCKASWTLEQLLCLLEPINEVDIKCFIKSMVQYRQQYKAHRVSMFFYPGGTRLEVVNQLVSHLKLDINESDTNDAMLPLVSY